MNYIVWNIFFVFWRYACAYMRIWSLRPCNKTIIQFTFVGYEFIITNSARLICYLSPCIQCELLQNSWLFQGSSIAVKLCSPYCFITEPQMKPSECFVISTILKVQSGHFLSNSVIIFFCWLSGTGYLLLELLSGTCIGSQIYLLLSGTGMKSWRLNGTPL